MHGTCIEIKYWKKKIWSDCSGERHVNHIYRTASVWPFVPQVLMMTSLCEIARTPKMNSLNVELIFFYSLVGATGVRVNVLLNICHDLVYVPTSVLIFLWLWAIWKHPNRTLTALVCAPVTVTMKLSLQSSSAFRVKRCEEVLNDPVFRKSENMKLLSDFTRLTEKLIDLTEKPIGGVSFDRFLFKNSFVYRKPLHSL